MIMVRIGLSEDKKSIRIEIEIWCLAQVIDSDNWLQEILKRCEEYVLEEIIKGENPTS